MNVKKGIIALLIFPLFIISMMPLSVHADESVTTDQSVNTAPFLGFNVQITGYGENMSSIQIPKINFSYAGNTVPSGYISGKLNCTSPSTPTSSAPCDIFSLTNNNGGYSDLQGLKVVFPLQSYLLDANGNAIINHQSYFFIDYEFVLDDNYKGYVIITSSDNVAHTIYVNGNNFHYETFTQDPANPLTFTISDYQLVKSNSYYWNFPIESFAVVSYAIDRYEISGINDNNGYYLPIFNVNQNDVLFRGYMNASLDYLFIFYMNNNGITSSTLSNYFDISLFDIVQFKSFYNFIWDGKVNGRMYWVRLKPKTSGNRDIKYIGSLEVKYMPVYFGNYDNKNVSTDFALRFGLSNKMLDDIDHIANGTTNSNASVSSADQQNDTFKDQANDLVTQEQEFTSDMKQNLQQIDTNFTFNNFGNKFMSSAIWVRDQYDRMITNTPFGTLVTFSLLLGLGLLIIGRTVNK